MSILIKSSRKLLNPVVARRINFTASGAVTSITAAELGFSELLLVANAYSVDDTDAIFAHISDDGTSVAFEDNAGAAHTIADTEVVRLSVLGTDA